MARKYSISLTVLLIFVVILYSIMPVVDVFFSQYLTTYSYMLVCVITFMLIVFGNGTQSFSRYVSILLPFIFYVLLSFVTRTSGIVTWGYQSLLFLLPIVIGYHLVYEQEDAADFRVFSMMRFAIIVTIITTIVGCIRNPSAARLLATIADSQDTFNITYSWQNIGGYEFVYTVVLIYPLVVYAFKQKKISLFRFVVVAVAVLALSILTEYTTALLLIIVSSFLIFMPSNMSTKKLITVLVVGLVGVLLLRNLAAKLLIMLADNLSSPFLSGRLKDLAGGTSALELSEDNRIWLYRYSFNTFLSHPLFGTMFGGSGRIGGHSFILDGLAQYGIIGGFTIVFMYRKIYSNFIKPFANQPGYGFVIWTFVQSVFLSTVNTGLWQAVLALYIPLVLFAINKERMNQT